MSEATLSQDEMLEAVEGVKATIRSQINEDGYDTGIVRCPFCNSHADWHVIGSGSLYVKCDTPNCLTVHTHHFETGRKWK